MELLFFYSKFFLFQHFSKSFEQSVLNMDSDPDDEFLAGIDFEEKPVEENIRPQVEKNLKKAQRSVEYEMESDPDDEWLAEIDFEEKPVEQDIRLKIKNNLKKAQGSIDCGMESDPDDELLVDIDFEENPVEEDIQRNAIIIN